MKLTNLIGKQVYSIYEGEILGTISGATFNNSLNKIKSFRVFDKDDNEYEILLCDIKALSDCVVVTNKNKLSIMVGDEERSPMFKDVIDESAKMCGKIIDAEISENGLIESFITSENVAAKPELIYLRKDFVYLSSTPIKISNFRPRLNKPSSLKEITVNIMESKDFLPRRATFNANSIVGKIAKSDLFGINNEIIIKANQQITQKIVTEATKHNRLNQLYYIAI